MKRPLVYTGICLYAAILVLTRLDASASIAACAVFALCACGCAVASLVLRGKGREKLARWAVLGLVGALTLTAGALSCFAAGRYRREPAEACAERDVSLSGVVLRVEPAGEKSHYVVRTTDIDGEAFETNVIVYSMGKFDAQPDDRVRAFHAVLRVPDDAGGASLRAGGVFLTCFGGTCEVTPSDGGFSVRRLFYRLRTGLTDRLNELMRREHAAVAAGLLLGDASAMDEETARAFRDCGVSHLFAVSGLHLTVWTGLLFALLARFGAVPPRLRAGVCAVFVVFYMELTGFGASVVRAGIMVLALCAASFVRRRYDGLSALFAALALMLLCEPYAAGDVGLTLSFLTTLGFLLYSRPAERLIRRAVRRVRLRPARAAAEGALTVVFFSVLATVFTLPVVVTVFGRVSLIGPLANLACAFPAELAMAFSGLAAVFAPVAVVAKPCVLASGLLIRYLTRVTGALASLPGATAPLSAPVFLYLFAFGFALAVLAAVLGRTDRRKLAALGAAAALFYGCALGSALYAGNSFTVRAIPVGDGLSAIVEIDGTRVLVGCTGTESYRLEEALRERGQPALVTAFTPGLGSESLLAKVRALCPGARYITPEDGSDLTVVLDGDVVLRYINRDGLRAVWIGSERGSCLALGDPGAKSLPRAWPDADVTVSRKRVPPFLSPAGTILVSGESAPGYPATGTDGTLTFTMSPLGEYTYSGRR